MKIRVLFYWVVSVWVATYAAGHAVASSATEVEAVTPASASLANMVSVPEAARSALLFIGILAVAYTYQRAWMNFRSSPMS